MRDYVYFREAQEASKDKARLQYPRKDSEMKALEEYSVSICGRSFEKIELNTQMFGILIKRSHCFLLPPILEIEATRRHGSP
jgi:hypothetical protein